MPFAIARSPVMIPSSTAFFALALPNTEIPCAPWIEHKGQGSEKKPLRAIRN